MSIIDELTDSFCHLPGIGKKSASRIVNYLLCADSSYVRRFSQELVILKEKIHRCKVCGAWTESDLCRVCIDPLRDRRTICVVENPQDVITFSSLSQYTGLFHVLGGVISPMDGIGPDELNIESLIQRVKENNIEEIIIATNPTFQGDSTALYLQKILKGFNIKITRLATGIPVGGDLEYADRLTLERSLKGRNTF